MKKIIFFLFLSLIFIFPKNLSAAASLSNNYCDFSSGRDVTLNTDCVIYEDVTGFYSGDLTVSRYATLTLHKTLVFPPNQNITLQDDLHGNGAIIYINTGGKIAQGKLCVKDADQDGVPDPINITTDPYGNTLKLDSPITQIQMVLADQTTNLCPDATWTYRENITDMTIADAQIENSSGHYATSDRELLRLGFIVSGVTDTLAAAGDIQAVGKNLLVCTGIGCPVTSFLNPNTGNIYTEGNIGIGVTSPASQLAVSGTTEIINPSDSTDSLTITNLGNSTIFQSKVDGNNTIGGEFYIGPNGIGVGVTDPTYSLHVSGTGRFSSTLTAANGFTLSAGTLSLPANSVTDAMVSNTLTASTLAANGANCSAGSFPLGVGATGAAESCTVAYTAAGTHTGLINSTATGNSYFTGGNVGIGTTTPYSLLSVGGVGNGSYVISGVSTGADVGVYGVNNSNGKGIYGINSGAGYGVYGENTSTGYGGYFKSASGPALVTGTGNVGIGTTSPTAKLTVVGYVSRSSGNNFSGAGGNAAWTTGFTTQNLNTSIVASNNIVGSGIYSVSDKRLKHNIEAIPEDKAEDFISTVSPVSFNWNDTGNFDTGFIAQDLISKGFGHLVSTIPNENLDETIDPNGVVSPKGFQYIVNYDSVVPILTTIVKKQEDEIASQQKDIDLLKSEINDLKIIIQQINNRSPQSSCY